MAIAMIVAAVVVAVAVDMPLTVDAVVAEVTMLAAAAEPLLATTSFHSFTLVAVVVLAGMTKMILVLAVVGAGAVLFLSMHES